MMSIDEQSIETLKVIVAPTVLQRFLLVEKEIFSSITLESSVSLSNQFRYSHDWTDSTLCYDEVDSSSFLYLLSSLKDFDIGFNENSVFIDVGCGIGKTLVIVAIMNTFSRVLGIEICDGLYKKSVETVRAFIMNYRSPLDQSDIEVIEGDGTFIDWSFADLVYIRATSFSYEMMERITNLASKMNSGSVLILINRRLINESYFDLMGTSRVDYAYGKMVAYLYRKNSKGLGTDSEALRSRLQHILKKQII